MNTIEVDYMNRRKFISKETSDFNFYKEEIIEVAKELCYNSKVIKKLKKAKTSDELTRIMHDARNGLYD